MEKNLPDRKPQRMSGFDYSSAQVFFVTVNCFGSQHLLGNIEDSEEENLFLVSPLGKVVEECILAIPIHYSGVEILAYVVMPNHIHILLSTLNTKEKLNLSTLINAFKSIATKKTRVLSPGIRLWQKSFYDHIIRDERDLQTHGEYIASNIQRWRKDQYF